MVITFCRSLCSGSSYSWQARPYRRSGNPGLPIKKKFNLCNCFLSSIFTWSTFRSIISMKAEARLRFCRLIFLKVRKSTKLLIFVELPENPCVDDDMVLHVVVGHPYAPVSYLFITVCKDAICDCEPFDDSTDGFPSLCKCFTRSKASGISWLCEKQMIVLYLSLSDSHSVVVHLVLCELFVLKTRSLLQLLLFVKICLFWRHLASSDLFSLLDLNMSLPYCLLKMWKYESVSPHKEPSQPFAASVAFSQECPTRNVKSI